MIRALVLFGVILSTACAYTKMEYGTNGAFQNEKGDKAVLAQAVWLKNKKDIVDVNLRLRNDTKNTVTIKFSEIVLEMSGLRGELQRPMFGIFELASGEAQERVFSYRFFTMQERSGPAKITMKISDGPMETYGKKMLPPLVMELPVDAK